MMIIFVVALAAGFVIINEIHSQIAIHSIIWLTAVTNLITSISNARELKKMKKKKEGESG